MKKNMILYVIIGLFIIASLVLTGCDENVYIPYYKDCMYVVDKDGSNLNILLKETVYIMRLIPNTNKILYITSDSLLCTIDYETEKIDTIFTNHMTYTIISKNGEKLVFKKEVNGNYELFMSNVDGTNVIQLTDLPGIEKDYYSFSFDSEKIVFISEKKDSKTFYTLCVLDLLSNEITTLLTTEDYMLTYPIFSPDGEKIYYIQEHNNTYHFSSLHVMDKNGTHLYEFGDDYVTWRKPLYITPDGEKIVYLSYDSLRIVNNDDSENVGIVKCDGYTLSNDGMKIAYSRSSGSIYIINLDGSGNRRIFSYLADSNPIFLLHGEKLAFEGHYEINNAKDNLITN